MIVAEKLKLRYHVEGGDLSQAGEASSEMKMTLRRLCHFVDRMKSNLQQPI